MVVAAQSQVIAGVVELLFELGVVRSHTGDLAPAPNRVLVVLCLVRPCADDGVDVMALLILSGRAPVLVQAGGFDLGPSNGRAGCENRFRDGRGRAGAARL